MAEQPFRWLHTDDASLGSFNTFSKLIRDRELVDPDALPDLRQARAVAVVGDYGDGPGPSQFRCLSFLVVDWASRLQWESALQAIREGILGDERRMGFKELNDKRCRRALEPLLAAADTLTGLLLTVAVHGSQDLVGRDELHARQDQWCVPKHARQWKKRPLERMNVAAQTVALLLAGLVREAEVIRFITDEDDIVADKGHALDTVQAIKLSVHQLAPGLERCVKMSTTKCDDGSLRLEDLSVLPDLAVGAVLDVVAVLERENCWPSPGVTRVLPVRCKWKTPIICEWLARRQGGLRKLVVTVRPAPGGRRKTGLLPFELLAL